MMPGKWTIEVNAAHRILGKKRLFVDEVEVTNDSPERMKFSKNQPKIGTNVPNK
jgi:hypothetical protein